jgi:hypothetical protein
MIIASLRRCNEVARLRGRGDISAPARLTTWRKILDRMSCRNVALTRIFLFPIKTTWSVVATMGFCWHRSPTTTMAGTGERPSPRCCAALNIPSRRRRVGFIVRVFSHAAEAWLVQLCVRAMTRLPSSVDASKKPRKNLTLGVVTLGCHVLASDGLRTRDQGDAVIIHHSQVRCS